MRYFLDTEFAEDGETIKLISIAIVAEDGREFFACCTDSGGVESANEWVREHVLPLLPDRMSDVWKPKKEIAKLALEFLARHNPHREWEFWAYYAAYDWVVFCQLFGTMSDLPKGLPMYCNDFKQELEQHRASSWDLPKQSNEHDALADAQWLREAFLIHRTKRPT